MMTLLHKEYLEYEPELWIKHSETKLNSHSYKFYKHIVLDKHTIATLGQSLKMMET